MNEQLAPFASRDHSDVGMGMDDIGFCLQVYNVGLNEIYRQTALQSRHRARVLDEIWRGYVDLLERTRSADGGALRRDMEVMKRELTATQHQTDLALTRAQEEQKRYNELKHRYEIMVKETEDARKAASGSAVQLDIQRMTNARQRKLIEKEARLKDKATKDHIGAESTVLQKDIEIASLREKFHKRDRDAFDAESTVASQSADLEEAAIVRNQLEASNRKQADALNKSAAEISQLKAKMSDFKKQIQCLMQDLQRAKLEVASSAKAQEHAESNFQKK